MDTSLQHAGRPGEPERAAARRAARRAARVDDGLAIVDRFVADVARRGIAEALAPDRGRGGGAERLEALAARLVDHQAAGLARRVRALAEHVGDGDGDGWAERVALGLGRLAWILRAYRTGPRGPAWLDARAAVGWTVRRDEVLKRAPHVHDTWLVLGSRRYDDGPLAETRTWLWGTRTGRSATIRRFVAGGGRAGDGQDAVGPAGTAQALALAFHEGGWSDRAVVARVEGPIGAWHGPWPGLEGAEALGRRSLDAWGARPWLGAVGVVLPRVVPVRLRSGALAVAWRRPDGPCARAAVITLVRTARGRDGSADGEHAVLDAVAAGRPVTLAGVWDGHALDPLLVVAGGGRGAPPVVLPPPRASDVMGPPEHHVPSEADSVLGDGLARAALLGGSRVGEASWRHEASPAAASEAGLSLWETVGLAELRARAGWAPGLEPLAPCEEAGPCPPEGPEGEVDAPSAWESDARAAILARAWSQPERSAPISEVLGRLAVRDERPPATWLPAVLDRWVGLGADVVRPALGVRGHWLAGRRPGWRAVRDEEAGGGAGASSAQDAWAAARRRDPVAAREALAERWATSGWDAGARDRVLGAMAVGLGPSDEPWLEGRLRDRSARVRARAAGLLARLEGSGLRARAEMRAAGLVRLSAGGPEGTSPVLVVHGPVDLPEDWRRDGLRARAPSGHKDAKGWWAVQALALVCPAFWPRHTGLTPAELIVAARRGARSGAGAILLEGWSRGVRLHRGVDTEGTWHRALWDGWAWRVRASEPGSDVRADAEGWLERLGRGLRPEDAVARVLGAVTARGPAAVLAETPRSWPVAMGLITGVAVGRPLDAPMAKAALALAKATLVAVDESPSLAPALLGPWRRLMRTIGTQLPVTLHGLARGGWPELGGDEGRRRRGGRASGPGAAWRGPLEAMQETLAARREAARVLPTPKAHLGEARGVGGGVGEPVRADPTWGGER